MHGQDGVVGIGAVQQQTIEWMTDIDLRKSVGNERVIQFFIEVHEIASNGFCVHIFSGAIEIIEAEQHERFSQDFIGYIIIVDDLAKRNIIWQRFREMLRQPAFIRFFLCLLIAVAKQLRDGQAVQSVRGICFDRDVITDTFLDLLNFRFDDASCKLILLRIVVAMRRKIAHKLVIILTICNRRKDLQGRSVRVFLCHKSLRFGEHFADNGVRFPLVQAVQKHCIHFAFDVERDGEEVFLKEHRRLLKVHFQRITEVVAVLAVCVAWGCPANPLHYSARAGNAENSLVSASDFGEHDFCVFRSAWRAELSKEPLKNSLNK